VSDYRKNCYVRAANVGVVTAVLYKKGRLEVSVDVPLSKVV